MSDEGYLLCISGREEEGLITGGRERGGEGGGIWYRIAAYMLPGA